MEIKTLNWKFNLLWIWSYPLSTEELLLKIVLPKSGKNPGKLLVRQFVFITFESCRAEILLKTILSQTSLKSSAEFSCQK